MTVKNILLSAYSCRPHHGSEPEVGWQWATNLAKLNYKVTVITHVDNKKKIKNVRNIRNLSFIYYDLPKFLNFFIKNKDYNRNYLYLILWQFGIFFLVRNILKNKNFDLIHHVTIVSARIPSFLAFLDKPFVFGPIAGGEKIPDKLKNCLTFKEKIFENIRELSNSYISFSPLMNACFYKSKKIIVTKDTLRLIPKIFRHKCKISCSVGIDKFKKKRITENKQKIFNICYVGNMIGLKGIEIIFYTFSKLLKNTNKIRLNLIGEGDKSRLLNLIKKYNISSYVNYIGKVEKKKLTKIYRNNDLLFFPSLRDSGGFVVLEALNHYLPCAVLDIGGPSNFISNKNGIKISPKNKDIHQISNEFKLRILKIIRNQYEYNIKINFIKDDIKKYSWKKIVKNVINYSYNI